MTEFTIHNAFDGFVQANLGSIPGAAVATTIFQGTEYTPQAETPFIYCFFPMIEGNMITTGTLGVYQWRGTYQINCNFPLGIGKQEVLTQRDAVRALFPNGLTIATADSPNPLYIKIFAPTVRPLITAGAWITGPVRIPWLLHEVSA